jgi:hypothetical protein
MLQLIIASAIQADRERDLAQDLRQRQWLSMPRDVPPAPPTVSSRALWERRSPIRARSTGL